MYLADALSRAFLLDIVHEQFEKEMDSEKFIHLMSSTSYVTVRKLKEIQEEIKDDESMQMIIQQIRSGWPDDKRHVPIEIKEYFPYRHELSEHEGLVYKAHNVLIPPTLRSDTLKKLHRSHQGIEKTKRLARQCIFRPGMNSQIDDIISKCGTCRQHRNSNTREPLQPHQLPKRPWQRIATDLFEWKGRQHLIIVDY